jgi:hypothetical protein
MSYKNILYLGLVLLLLSGGCGLKEGVVHKEPKSFLWFTGNTHEAIVYIDDLNPIILDEINSSASDKDENTTNKSGQVHYQISPGKHTVVVIKSGKEVVNRNILIGDGITREIQIP